MEDYEWLAKRFEENRAHLRAVGYRMLGSLSEADDAVQEAWLRLSRSDTSGIENLGGWLTTVVGRVCLNMLRSRRSRREEPLGEPPGTRVPDPIVSRADGLDPEHEALLAVLDPDVVLRIDGGAVRAGLSREVRGVRAVAEQTLTFSRLSPFVRPALVNGAAGVVVAPRGRPFAVMGFTVRRGKIVEIDVLADPARLRQLDLAILDDLRSAPRPHGLR